MNTGLGDITDILRDYADQVKCGQQDLDDALSILNASMKRQEPSSISLRKAMIALRRKSNIQYAVIDE